MHRKGRRLLGGLGAALLLCLALLVAPAAPATAVGETTFRNPLLANGADPWLQYHDGNYYLAVTTWDQTVTMRKSPTLAGLGAATPKVVWADTSTDRCCTHWAPEFHRLNGPNGVRWYMVYVSGRSGTYDYQHMSVLESAGDDPMGPYIDRGSPVPTAWNIDGSYLTLNGRLYLLWSEFQGADQSLWISAMSNPWTLTGSRSIISRPTYGWETVGLRVNEGPEVLQRDGRTFIIYSASYCNTADYKLGQLTYNGGDPLSASGWTKKPTPVFQQGNGVYGPGHNGFFTSPDGTQNWIVYHGNASSSQGCGTTRSTRAQPFTWNSDGSPNFGAPVSTSTSVPVPSGERGPITAPVEGSAFQLVNRNSGLCAASASTSDGANVAQQACTGTAANWVLDSTSDGYYRLVGKNGNKVLDAAGCGTADGTNVQQYAWMDNTCQQFQVLPTSDGWFRLVNRNSGKVVEIADCGTAAGANVRLYSWLNTNCQQWRLQPVGDQAVTSVANGKVLDVANCSTATGTNVRAWQYNGAGCQKWTFTHTDNGYYQIHPAHASGSCLIVAGSSTADAANIQQGACSGNNAQWRFEPLADGSVRLVARHSGKAVDLSNCGLADGTNIQQYAWLNNTCQRFQLQAV